MILRKLTTTLIGLFLLATAACSPNQTNGTFYTRVSEPKLKSNSVIPAPTGDVILTITGKIGTTNQGSSIVMDRNLIESAGQIEYKVTDPFEDKVFTYRGPLMTDLLGLWQVSDTAKTATFTALDDYVKDIPVTELQNYPVIFALQQDGQYLPVANRGPAMLVFPYDNYKFDPAVFNDYWVWQIKSIEFK